MKAANSMAFREPPDLLFCSSPCILPAALKSERFDHLLVAAKVHQRLPSVVLATVPNPLNLPLRLHLSVVAFAAIARAHTFCRSLRNDRLRRVHVLASGCVKMAGRGALARATTLRGQGLFPLKLAAFFTTRHVGEVAECESGEAPFGQKIARAIRRQNLGVKKILPILSFFKK